MALIVGFCCDRGLIMTPFLVLLSLSLSLSFISSEGAKNEEDLEIDRQLKILNKPYIKSIKTEEGDIFDCIDIYEQPAFDHPLLKNHSVQMKPSGFPEEVADATSSPPLARPFAVGLKEGCPFGTVPIKRTRKEDLIWAKMFMKNLGANAGSPAYHYATRILPSSPSKNYLGSAALINVQNPQVTNNQFSQAFVQIRSGIEVIDTIQVGWMVNRKLYGDNYTRTFGSWTVGENYGCFNILCSGFVQVNPTFPLGYVLKNISGFESDQYVVRFNIFKDPKSGNWWLEHDNFEQAVGYWPKSLFPSLSSSASEISWGGGVYTDNNADSPPMGSGYFAEEGFTIAAYVREFQIIDESNKMRYPDESLLQYFTDSPKCYTIGAVDGIDHAFLYGGPGGNCEG